jgi:hypothetical protein
MSFWTKNNIPHDRELWKLLAERIGGKFIKGNSWENEKVILHYKNREITLISEMKSIGKSRHFENQVKCLVSTKTKFTLKIFIENAFTHAGKIFGINDIELDNSKFDDEFFVKSNNKEKAVSFLNSSALQKVYFAATKNLDLLVSIEIKDNDLFHTFREYPPNSSLIVIRANMIVTEMERLINWFELCKITLDRLIEIGEAEDVSPDNH